MKISQSMMKSYVDYLNQKECGLLFKGKYIDKNVESVASDAMKEGIYFEYLATGALPRTGIVPEPEKTAKGALTTAYDRIPKSAQLFKDIIKHYGIKILKIGLVISTDDMTGITDVYAEWNGEKCIIDLKYSGLIDDKWNDLGWETDSLNMKDSLMIQGVHYKLLAEESLGIKDIPFYYFIFNSKNPTDMKIIKQVVDPDKMYFHKQQVLKMKAQILRDIEKGFRAYPDYRKCINCPLFSNCDKKAEYPQIIEVHY
jgi:hypothetical protein